MKKMFKGFFCSMGDASVIGIGALIMYGGYKITKWAFEDFEYLWKEL